MIVIDGKKYIVEKEVSHKYGVSVQWLQKCRHEGDGPIYFKLRGRGKVFYPEADTDKWFKESLVSM